MEAVVALTKLTLVQDLAAVMLAAGLVAAIFHYLGWPKVIGYIAAGTLMGLPQIEPYLIANEESINVLSNLGVIFLMFTLGLELNIRKLRKIGSVIFPTAVIDLLFMLLAGYALGRHVFHWGMIPSLFLGAVVCDSSTTLLAKSLEEMGCSKEHFASVIFGTTISEDVLTIGIMAVLSGLALTGQFQAAELRSQLTLLILFLVGVLSFGFLLLPPFLNKLKQMKDDETLLVIIFGICFGISFIAEKMEFSLALGAFLVGAVVSESSVSSRVHQGTESLRSIFSAVFFVTIGLMVDLPQMWNNLPQILAVSLLVLVVKTLNCGIGSYILGQPHRDSIKIGVGLAQIGDFAYMVALMGMTLNDGQEPYPSMYQIAVGASVITTLVNPFLLKKSQTLANWLDNIMPPRLLAILNNYTRVYNKAGLKLSITKDLNLKPKIIFFIIDYLLIEGVFVLGHFIEDQRGFWASFPAWIADRRAIILWSVCCFINFLITINAFLNARKLGEELAGVLVPSFLPDPWKQSFHRLARIVIILFLSGLLLIEFTYFSALLFLEWWSIIGLLIFYITISLVFWKSIKVNAQFIQRNLSQVLTKTDTAEPAEEPTPTNHDQNQKLVVPQDSPSIGKTLAQLRLRNNTGATIVNILRSNGTFLPSPGPNDTLEAGDTLTLNADENQCRRTQEYLASPSVQNTQASLSSILEMQVRNIRLPESAVACNHSLKELRLRNLAGTTVVRIVPANNQPVDNPGPDTTLNPGDDVFLLGNNAQLMLAQKILLYGTPQATEA